MSEIGNTPSGPSRPLPIRSSISNDASDAKKGVSPVSTTTKLIAGKPVGDRGQAVLHGTRQLTTPEQTEMRQHLRQHLKLLVESSVSALLSLKTGDKQQTSHTTNDFAVIQQWLTKQLDAAAAQKLSASLRVNTTLMKAIVSALQPTPSLHQTYIARDKNTKQKASTIVISTKAIPATASSTVAPLKLVDQNAANQLTLITPETIHHKENSPSPLNSDNLIRTLKTIIKSLDYLDKDKYIEIIKTPISAEQLKIALRKQLATLLLNRFSTNTHQRPEVNNFSGSHLSEKNNYLKNALLDNTPSNNISSRQLEASVVQDALKQSIAKAIPIKHLALASDKLNDQKSADQHSDHALFNNHKPLNDTKLSNLLTVLQRVLTANIANSSPLNHRAGNIISFLKNTLSSLENKTLKVITETGNDKTTPSQQLSDNPKAALLQVRQQLITTLLYHYQIQHNETALDKAPATENKVDKLVVFLLKGLTKSTTDKTIEESVKNGLKLLPLIQGALATIKGQQAKQLVSLLNSGSEPPSPIQLDIPIRVDGQLFEFTLIIQYFFRKKTKQNAKPKKIWQIDLNFDTKGLGQLQSRITTSAGADKNVSADRIDIGFNAENQQLLDKVALKMKAVQKALDKKGVTLKNVNYALGIRQPEKTAVTTNLIDERL